ncbi:MAG TPA: L-threonine 3-dehydrogenase [Streptosporangiales bacterium]
MKALVKTDAAPGLTLTDVPEPAVGADDVLIRVLRTGVCGTDLHIQAWDEWSAEHVKPPLVVGHEFVGEIVEVGAQVVDLEPGDVVSGEGHIVCGRCRNCMAGQRVMCARTQGLGVDRDGCFAEYVALPAGNVWRHHDGIDLDVAAIFDPFGNAVHTALKFPVLGEDVLITGAGPIGIMAAAVAKHAGARYVVVSDISDYRLKLAETVGVTLALDAREHTAADAQRMLGMREGFDVGMEMSGKPVAFRDMLDNMKHGGKIALLGLPSEQFAVDWSRIVLNMLTVTGIYGREMFETWYEMSVLLQCGLDISGVVTHRLPYEEYEKAFEICASGQCGKVILEWADVR